MKHPRLVDLVTADALRYVRSARRPDVASVLFPAQLAFVACEAKRKAAHPGRRAGKTTSVAAWILVGAYDSPGSLSVFIGLTKNTARRTFLRPLRALARRLGLEVRTSEKDGQLFAHFPNGSSVWISGVPDKSEYDKFRGDAYKRIAIDEAGSLGAELEVLVEEAIEPALLDLDGELALIGTPTPVNAGYFYEVTTGANGRKRWPTFHWTVLDNPYLPHAARLLAEKCEANGWTSTTPRYRREYLGEWVLDIDSLAFPFDAKRNVFDAQSPEFRALFSSKQLLCSLGIDIGFDPGKSAWLPGMFVASKPEFWIPECRKVGRLYPDDVAVETQAWLDRYRVVSTVIDQGGQGKPYAERLRERYGMGVEAADKRDKCAAIEAVRGDILSGKLKVDPHGSGVQDLLDEWSRLTVTEDRSDIEGGENHLSDACLYSHRKACTFHVQAPPEPPIPSYGSHEYAQRAVAEHLRELEREERKRGDDYL